MNSIGVPRRVVKERRLTVDDVHRFFASLPDTKKPKFPRTLDPEEWTLTNTPTGIGDSVMLTDIERAASSANRKATSWLCTTSFRALQNFNPYHRTIQSPHWISLSAYQGAFDLGPGHNFQRARRIFGLPIDSRPSGCLVVPGAVRKNRVSLHFEAGSHAENQKCYHPQPRVVYPQNLEIVRRFIRAHPELDFFEIGGSVLKDTVPSLNCSLDETIRAMSECCLHIGIISGPYHMANALGVPTICIINFPSPWQLMLPCVKNIDIVEAEWLYPQSHILHQDHDSSHWPMLSLYNLERAYNRETYPYDDPTPFLEMVTK